MAKNREFYRGQKKRRNYALIPFVVGLALITLIVVAFYGLQKYVVITKDGVQVVLPGQEAETPLDADGEEIREFETVATDLVFDEPDYSRITARAGRQAKPMRAIYIAAEDVNRDNLLKRAEQLNSGNALILEMKPRSGYLLWVSNTDLDADLRRYVIDLINELYAIGFDEVILSDVCHPVPETKNGEAPMTFLYTREMSADPSPINAICGFALYVANQMEEREDGKLLSIYLDTARSLVRYDEGTGQNGVLFFKLYDRIYYRTDRYTYTYNYTDIENSVTIGSPHDRFVPVVINYLPENSSWVYIEDLPEGTE